VNVDMRRTTNMSDCVGCGVEITRYNEGIDELCYICMQEVEESNEVTNNE